MRYFSALLITLCLVSSSAFAYDDLITNANPNVVPMNRGLLTFGFSLTYLNAGNRIDSDGEKQPLDDTDTNLRVPLHLVLRMTKRFQPFALIPIVSKGSGGETETGLGDIWLGAKYAVMPEGLLSLRGALILANGDDKKGLGTTGGFGLDIGAIGEKRFIGNALISRAQFGLRWQGEDSDTKLQPGMGFYVTGDLGYRITKNTSVHCGLELLTNGDNKNNGNDVTDSGMTNLDLKIGAVQKFEHISIGGTIVYTVFGKNSLANIGFILSTGYIF